MNINRGWNESQCCDSPSSMSSSNKTNHKYNNNSPLRSLRSPRANAITGDLRSFFSTLKNPKDLDASLSTLLTADLTDTSGHGDEPERIEKVPFIPILERFAKGVKVSKQSTRFPRLSFEEQLERLPVFTWSRVGVNEKADQRIQAIDELILEDEDEVSEHSDIRFDELQKLKLLGEGQFGQVWLVSGRNRPYAMKVQAKFELVEDDKVEFVLREKDIMKQMDHPFISRLYQTFQDPYFVYMLMQMVQGGELWSLMHPVKTGGEISSVSLPESQARFYTYSVADALAYIHNKGCAYRDLKPENILIDRMGYPILIDFGLARFLDKGEKAFTMVGTPSYLSPEVVEATGHNASVDHWALGVLLYELLAGCNPFFWEGMDQMTLFNDIVESDFPRPEGINEDAMDLIAGLLTKDPDTRLGSRGDQHILSHAWFRDMDAEAMRRRKITAPWLPDVKSPMDTCCFQDWSSLEDMMQRGYPRLDAEDEARFEAF